MDIMAEQTKADIRHDEIMGAINAIKTTLDKREYLDEQVKELHTWVNGNGKPGAKSQMHSLLLWNKAVIVVLIINILSNWLL